MAETLPLCRHGGFHVSAVGVVASILEDCSYAERVLQERLYFVGKKLICLVGGVIIGASHRALATIQLHIDW